MSEKIFILRRNKRDMVKKCTFVFMKVTRYSCLILIKIEFSQNRFS